MPRFTGLLLFGLAMLGCSSLPPAPPARPAILDMQHSWHEYWLERTAAFREDTAQRATGGIVFLGDSLTQGFDLEAAFPGLPVINRGISGDRIVGVLSRLPESAFDLKPSKIFLLIGCNDSDHPDEMTLTQFREQYAYLFYQLRQHCPQSEIYMQSIPPLGGEKSSRNPFLAQINAEAAMLSKRYGLHFIDLTPVFTRPDGSIRPELRQDDLVHINPAGYAVWREAILPLVRD